MKTMYKKLMTILLALAMTFSLSACGGNGDEGSSASNSGNNGEDEYVVRTIGTTTLGGFVVGSTMTANEQACTILYDSIWTINPVTHEIESDVLTEWYYEDDLTIVCTMKDNIYFSNGEKATSEDVLYSITNYITRGSAIGDMYGPLDVENSYCVDELTCVFKFTEPWGPGIYTWASYLYDKSWCEEVGWESTDWYNPVGSGPYKVSEYVSDDHFTLVLRDDYWNEDVTFEVNEWQFINYSDASTMAIDFEQGKLDLVFGLNTTDFDRYLADSSIGVGTYLAAMNDVMFITFGFENNSVFEDEALRQAMCLAVDWAAIGDMAYSSIQTLATSTLPSSSPYYLETGAYPYDPDQAKQILEDAGYAEGELVFDVVTMDTQYYKDVFEGLQYYWAQIGITLNLTFGDTASTMGTWLTPGGTDLGLQSNPTGSTNGEPHSCWMQMAMTGAFYHTHILDDTFQELNDQALHTVDEEERTALYHELQQYMHDHYLTMPVCEYYYVYGYNPDVFTEEDMQNSVVAGSVVYLWALS